MRKSISYKKIFFAAGILIFMLSVRGYGQSDSAKYVMPDVPPKPPTLIDENVNNTAPLSIEESAWMEADGLKFELKLSDEQYKEAHRIILAVLKKKEILWDAGREKVIDNDELMERLDKIDDGIETQLKDVLTAEQLEKYTSKRKRLKSK